MRLFVLSELHGNTIGIIDIEVFCGGLRVTDGRGIHARVRCDLVRRLQVIRCKAQEHTLALKGLTLRHGDEFHFRLALGVVQIRHVAAIGRELVGNAQLGQGAVMPGYLALSAAITVAVLLTGIMIFNKVEKTFMDTV